MEPLYLILCPPLIAVKLKDLVRRNVGSILAGRCGGCPRVLQRDLPGHCRLQAGWSITQQRKKRWNNKTQTVKTTPTDFLLTGIALSSAGMATIAGGLMGMLSIMGLPKLRRRVGQIGELRDFRTVAKPRWMFPFSINILTPFCAFNQDLCATTFQYPFCIPFVINSILYLFRV